MTVSRRRFSSSRAQEGRAAWAALVILFSAGCADVWGFSDLTVMDGGPEPDASTDDGGYAGDSDASGALADAAATCTLPIYVAGCKSCLNQQCASQKQACGLSADCCNFLNW